MFNFIEGGFLIIKNDKNFLKDILFRLDFPSVPELICGNNNPINFYNQIKSKFPVVTDYEENFLDVDLKDEYLIKNHD